MRISDWSSDVCSSDLVVMRIFGADFQDRRDAGIRLAAALEHLKPEDPVVLALPRGGVPVGSEVARALGGALAVPLVRKRGTAGPQEMGIGSVVDGSPPQVALNEDAIPPVHNPQDYITGQ